MADEAKSPVWGYRKGEAQIFDDGVIPAGWVDSPAKVKGAKPTYEDPAAVEAAPKTDGEAG